MTTRSPGLEATASRTTNWNVRVTSLRPVVMNDDSAVRLPVSVTDGPLTWIHLYVSGSPSGSWLPVPLSVMVVSGSTAVSGPALAIGAPLLASTALRLMAHTSRLRSEPT